MLFLPLTQRSFEGGTYPFRILASHRLQPQPLEKRTPRAGCEGFAKATWPGIGREAHPRGTGGLDWSAAARHGRSTRIWSEKRYAPLSPPEGAWRFRLSRRAQRSKAFPIGRGLVREWMSRKWGVTWQYWPRRGPHGLEGKQPFSPREPPPLQCPLWPMKGAPRLLTVIGWCAGMTGGVSLAKQPPGGAGGSGEGDPDSHRYTVAWTQQACVWCVCAREPPRA